MNGLLAASGLVNWTLLGKILVVSTVISVGLVVLFTLVVNSMSAFRREGGQPAARALSVVVGAVMSSAIVATLLWGLSVIVHK